MQPQLRRLRTGLVATTAAAVGLAVAMPSGAVAAPAGASVKGAAKAHVNAVPSWTHTATNTGAVSDATRLRLTAVLQLKDAAGAQKLALAVSDPKNTLYRHFVTPSAWRKAYAPTDKQVASVTTWLKGHGFAVTAVPANGRYVSFTGTAAQAEAAFSTTIDGFIRSGSAVMANTKPVTLPKSLVGVVAGLTGLDTSARAVTDRTTGDTRAKAVAVAAATATPAVAVPADELPPPEPVFRNSGPCSTYYNARPAFGFVDPLKDRLFYVNCGYKPAQLRGAYGLDFNLANGIDGRGATVAVVDAYASPNILSDAQTYSSLNDPSHPFRSYQLIQNLPLTFTDTELCGGSGWYGEETLDVEAVHAMAPGAKILYMGAQSCYDADLSAAINTVVDNGLAQVITNSYGEPEQYDTDTAAIIESLQTELQAAAEGISIMFSSGDSGDEVDNTGLRQTDSPASDPYVTAVGGTALAVGATKNWEREIGWGTGIAPLVGNTFPLPAVHQSGGGGGTSRIFDQPAYQAGVVPTKIAKSNGSPTPMRVVPDVALDADPQTGMLVGETQTFPDGSAHYSQYRIGGTSLSSPLLAGLVASDEQALGGALGFLNPLLYFLNGTDAFHDVKDGTAITAGVVRVNFANSFDASEGLVTSLRTFNQTQSIYTRKGYDDVTGVGTPGGTNFLFDVLSLFGGHRVKHTPAK